MPTISSPVTPEDIRATIPDSTGSICTKLKGLWSLANQMYEFFVFLLNSDGTLSDNAKALFSGTSVPVGTIVAWPLDIAPDGWIKLDGSIISRTQYAALFAVYGTKYGVGDNTTTFGLPDLRRKFILGTSSSNVAGSTGGAENRTLIMANLPSEPAPLGARMARLLGYPYPSSDAVSDDVFPLFSGIETTVVARLNVHEDHDENVLGDLGTDTPFEILPPFFSAIWIAKI